jgi:hypothetical protein
VLRFTELRDVHGLEELVIILAHGALAAVEHVELHPLERSGHLHRIKRFGFFCRKREHPHFVDGARIENSLTVIFRSERLFESLRGLVIDVRMPLGDLEHLVVQIGLLDGGRTAGTARVIRVPVDLQSGIGGSLQQQGKVLAPIAGYHGVGARCLDLGDVGSEVGDLEQRMQFVADDLDVGPLGGQHFPCRRTNRFAERIILIDQIELLDRRDALHVIRQRFHLDVGVGIPAEMPEAALLVGEDRIDRGVVKVEHFLAGIAFVVFGDEIRQCACDRGAVTLSHIAHAGIDGLLRLDQAFLRIGLVVERNDLDLLAEDAALGIRFIGKELKRLQADFADAGAAARQRIDISDLDRLLRHCHASEHRQQGGSHHELTHVVPPWNWLFLDIDRGRWNG